MSIDHGTAGPLRWAAVGNGPTVLVLPGLSAATGVARDSLVRGTLSPLRAVRGRRLVVMNRRAGLAASTTMAAIADEHARAITALGDGIVDVVGFSTGASIALQLAADHPGAVRRLAVVGGACRLSPTGREVQARVAELLRAGRARAAARAAASAVAPRGTRAAAGAVAWLGAGRAFGDPDARDDLATTLEAEVAFDLTGGTDPISAPTLVVMGDRDRFYGPELARETASLIPGSHLVIVRHRGHLTASTHHRTVATLGGFLLAD